MPPLPEYRENAHRSVVLDGEIDDALVERVTAKICLLRSESSDPITVYINSPGGYIRNAEQIRQLLKAPNQDGEVCRTITVATTKADSAASGLLALGDYAIAYPGARIHCHGARLSGGDITSQLAQELANSLKKNDNDFALRLAQRTFERMTFHFANLKGEFDSYRERHEKFLEKQGKTGTLNSELECFAYGLNMRLSSGARRLPRQAFHQHERLVEIQDHIFATDLGVADDDPLAKKEAVLLTRLLDYELQHKDLTKWNLSEGGIEDLTFDFTAFADYIFGPHTQSLDDHLDTFGSFFLTADEVSEYVKICQEDPAKGRGWLKEHAEPQLAPMWYFVVSLCRLLQNDEYPLTATDAYWLGMVDEVIGERLPTIRLIAENPDPSVLFPDATDEALEP